MKEDTPGGYMPRRTLRNPIRVMLYILTSLIMLGTLSCSLLKNNAQISYRKSTADSLTSALQQVLNKGYFNGIGVAIVNKEGILYEHGFGFSDRALQKKYTEHTIQNIASISKTLVGVALMKAEETGKLRLDDPINKYLPFQVVNPFFPDVAITIRHLANHTSAIVDNEYYFTRNYFLKPNQDMTGMQTVFDDTQVFNACDSVEPMPLFLKELLTVGGKWYRQEGFLKHKPGALYEYSNTATTLAAYIIELATGMPFDSFTKKYILDPLQMNASGWKFSDVDFTRYSKLYGSPESVLPFYGMVSYPDGNFITSVADLGKYLQELIRGYNGQGALLSVESYKELFRQQLDARNFIDRNDKNPYSESYNVGIFMGFGYTGYIGHTGGDPGVVSIMFFDPETNTGRLLITNTSITGKEGNDAFYELWDVLEKYQAKLKKSDTSLDGK